MASIGYVMMPARGHQPPFGFPHEHLGTLAEMEHDRWLTQKHVLGWRYRPERNDADRTNPAMLPWRAMTEQELVQRYGPELAAAMGTNELPEDEKQKDRELVRQIPTILAEAGYTAVRLSF